MIEKKPYVKYNITSPMKELCTVGGHVYELTHPGTRKSSELLQEMVNLKTGFLDLIKIIEYSLVNIIEPLSHDERLTFDEMQPSDAEEWSAILPSFLKGEGVPDRFCYKETKKKESDPLAKPSGS